MPQNAAQFPRYFQFEETAPNSAPVSGLWGELSALLDVQQHKPVRLPGIIAKELHDGSGHHYMLKNRDKHSYVRLSPEEYWVWEQLNGEKTIQQLVLGYFLQYKSFAFAAILGLVNRLRETHMLTEPPRNLYAEVTQRIEEQSPLQRIVWLARAIFSKELLIKNLDGHLDRFYRYGGWLFYTIPFQILFLLLSVVGLICFFLLTRDPRYNLLSGETAFQAGLLAVVPLLIHEFAHALTAKHVGCEVNKGGAMFYYGMPALFIDTTDVWMFGKWARLAVTWAGPYTGYIIGGACSIAVYFYPNLDHDVAVALLHVAMTGIFVTTLNVLPWLKLDGYHLLADALEIPNLRERSIEFITRRLRSKLSKRDAWSREEKIFLVFGLVAILSAAYFTWASVGFWDAQATKSVSELLNLQGDLGAILQTIVMVLLSVFSMIYLSVLVVDAVKQAVKWLRKKGWISTSAGAAASLILGSLTFALLPNAALPTLSVWVLSIGGIVVCGLAAWLAFSNFKSMLGSRHVWMWLLFSIGAVLAGAGFVVEFQAQWTGTTVPIFEAALFFLLLLFFTTGRFLISLRGWRGWSLILILAGVTVLFVSLFIQGMEWHVLSALLLLGGVTHWTMRPVTQTSLVEISTGSTREKMMIAFREIRSVIITEVERDFGALLRKRVEDGSYQSHKAGVGGGEFANTLTGLTPNDYGSAMSLSLEDLLASVEQLAGRTYTRRALAHGYDRLHWELQEIAEDYILKYVPHAVGLSNDLTDDQDDLNTLLRSVPLFASMPEEKMRVLGRRFKVYKFKAGDEIVRAGDKGDAFYIIRAGRLDVVGTIDFEQNKLVNENRAMLISTRSRRITQLTRGDYFGEFALLEGKPRAATVRALTAVEVLRLSKQDFDKLLQEHFDFGGNVREEMRLLGLMRQIPLFAEFDGAMLRSLLPKFQKIIFTAGEDIFRQGNPADKFYIIELGKVSVQIDGVERSTLGTGEYFGEIALLMNLPRTATVTALQPTTLLQFRAADFHKLLQESSSMKQALERTSSRRTLANERWFRERQLAVRG